VSNVSLHKSVYSQILQGWKDSPTFKGMGRHLAEDIHGQFRDGFSAILSECEGADAIPKPLLRRFISLNGMLHHHHSIEDNAIWPQLRQMSNELKLEADLLEKDHKNLNIIVDRIVKGEGLESSALMMSGGRVELKTGAGYAALKEFVDFLEDHLIREELLIVPLMLNGTLRV
jgi:iron-sulfur cluster repair protein YtfE (RIC family)